MYPQIGDNNCLLGAKLVTIVRYKRLGLHKGCLARMKSRHWVIDQKESLMNHPAIIEAAALLKSGEVVAFPTETVYGLGGDAFSSEAVDKIFAAKGRPSDNPLIIHLYDQSELHLLVHDVPESAKLLLAAFVPGPLTLILKGNGRIAPNATAGLSSVAIRIPDHPVARALLQSCGLPLAAPSANRSGKPSPTTAGHVIADLDGRIAGILDAGETGVGVESTVLDLTVSPPMILRPGGISLEQIEEVIGEVTLDPSLGEEVVAPRSPGMKYRHYAPDAPLWIVDGEDVETLRNRLAVEAKRLLEEGKRIGILTTIEGLEFYQNHIPASETVVIESCGSRGDLNSVARLLYDRLRRFNHSEVDRILAEAFPTTGIGSAIMNRLVKAAGGRRL